MEAGECLSVLGYFTEVRVSDCSNAFYGHGGRSFDSILSLAL